MKDTINLPWNMAVAATGKPAFARRMGATVAKEAKALGIQQVFGPVIDVNNNAENPVINVRSFGENPGDVARFGIAFANGLQSENIIATAKHFPGHGDTAVDSHRGLPVINYSPERMENTEFLPFRQIIKSGVGSVMISHISLPQLDNEEVKPLKNSIKAEYTEAEIITENTTIPATLSKNIVTGLLKKDMNFDGLVVTDAMDMSGLTLYFDQSEAAVRAILAGNDILLKPADTDATLAGIKKAVQTGRITQKRIDESVRKILAWKYKLGLFEKKITPLDKIDRIVSAQETLNLSNDIARNAITLVKNNDKLLPLKEKQKVFALNITNGKDIDAVGKEFINSLRANGLEVTSLTLDERSGEKDFNRALIESNKSDLVITALFGRVRSGAKNSIGIPEAGENVLRQILKQDKPNISVAFGNPYLILGFPEMKNYIVAYGDMVSLQEATANALTGKIDFKGKLPITIGDFKRGSGLKIK
jgi:beta-N-acetylhexosaminidase